MVSVLAFLVLALSLTVLLILLPADFRKSFFNPETLGERLLVRSLGLVAVATLIAEVALGHGPDNGLNGLSPCVMFGIYCSLVFYVRAVFFLRRRQAQKRELPADAG